MNTFQVDVSKLPVARVGAIKALRVAGKTTLATADRLHQWLAQRGAGTVLAGVEREVADHVAGVLRASGLAAEVSASSVRTPLVFAPLGHRRFRWQGLRLAPEK
jgi:hypothetical protein